MGREYQLQYKYGIGLPEYRAMLEAQNYCCAICDKRHGEDKYAPGATKGLSVDHCHETGANRGLLCNDCNRAIGQLQDSAVILRRAADYIEEWSRKHGRSSIDADELIRDMMEDKSK